MAMSSASGAAPGSAAPTAWAMRPQLGSDPCRAALTSGELATARATASTPSGCPPDTTTRPALAAPSPSRTMSSASWRSSASSAWPKVASASLSGSTATPLTPLAMRIAVSLVESCPSTEMRSNERLTQTTQQQVGGLRAEHGAVCTKHSIVAKQGGSCGAFA